MSLYVTNENGKRWFKLEGQGCLAFPEDALVQVLEHRIKQKDAMIEWLARELADRTDVCTDCPAYIDERCMEPTKRCYKAWITAAEKVVQDAAD